MDFPDESRPKISLLLIRGSSSGPLVPWGRPRLRRAVKLPGPGRRSLAEARHLEGTPSDSNEADGSTCSFNYPLRLVSGLSNSILHPNPRAPLEPSGPAPEAERVNLCTDDALRRQALRGHHGPGAFGMLMGGDTGVPGEIDRLCGPKKKKDPTITTRTRQAAW